jgi:hypothetical protein
MTRRDILSCVQYVESFLVRYPPEGGSVNFLPLEGYSSKH